MKYCFNICTCFCLVIFQTTVMPYFSLFDRFYDLLFPFIIYLSLFRSVRESIPLILFFGFVMDNLTGGPFGLYLTTYLWMFIGIRWVITFMDVEDSVLMLFIVAAGVLIQNFIIIGTIVMFEPVSRFSPAAISTVGVQVLWAVFTGPIFLVFFNYSHGRWDKWLKEVFAKEKGDRYGLIE